MWPSSLAVRMPPCHGGGRRFKSDLGRHLYAGIAQLVEHLTCNEDVAGSSPVSSSIHSWIAQLVEQSAVNRSVVGSSPTPGANYHAGIAQR